MLALYYMPLGLAWCSRLVGVILNISRNMPTLARRSLARPNVYMCAFLGVWKSDGRLYCDGAGVVCFSNIDLRPYPSDVPLCWFGSGKE